MSDLTSFPWAYKGSAGRGAVEDKIDQTALPVCEGESDQQLKDRSGDDEWAAETAWPDGVETDAAEAHDIDVLARTLYGEARGESLHGIEAVASVIVNRMRGARLLRKQGGVPWWGESIAEVCRKPWQFSCWNENDPNREKLLTVDKKDTVFRLCRRVARRAVAGKLTDRTLSATHYHTVNISPKWALGKSPCAVIGHHMFYNDIN